MNLSAVILAAGDGKRMHSARPKPLHTVAGKPMLSHVVSAVRRAIDVDITVVVRPEHAASTEFRAAVDREIRLAVQSEQLGTAHAVAAAGEEALAADRILVLYADTPLIQPETIAGLVRTSETSGADVCFVTANPAPVDGLGRVLRDGRGAIVRIVEQSSAGFDDLQVSEVNSGWYAFSGQFLRAHLPEVKESPAGERYLTDLVEIAIDAGGHVLAIPASDPAEVIGVNTREQLAMAETALQTRYRNHWLAAGVTLVDPAASYFGPDVEIAPDVIIHPNSHIRGDSIVRELCEIGPNSILEDTEVGPASTVVASFAKSARIGARCEIGPFSRLRPGAVLGDDVRVGNYAEVKNSTLGSGTKIGHFSYVGDSTVGKNVNVGAGAVFVNYDGVAKNRTTVGDGAFIGSGTMLVAPLNIGAGALTGAGSVVTRDVAPGATVIGVPARVRDGQTGDRRDQSVTGPMSGTPG